MPTYRRPANVGTSIRTLLEQSLGDFELLVRDDGDGADGTREAVAAAAAGDVRVRYTLNPTNLRMPGNLNAGILETRGEYIAVCHDHDLYRPEYLRELANLLDRYPDANYAHCGIELVNDDGSVANRQIGEWAETTPGRDWVRRMLGSFNCPVTALSMVRRSAHERYGLYNPLCGFIADVELWFRLAAVGGVVAYAAKPLIGVMQREVDHEANRNPWPLLAILFGIHRHYTHATYSGAERLVRQLALSARADEVIVRAVASHLKRREWKGFGSGAPGLAIAAGPAGRVLASLGQGQGP